MATSGRVLVIEERSCSETARLWDAIRDEGYELVTMPLDRTLEQATTAQRPDVRSPQHDSARLWRPSEIAILMLRRA